MFPNIEIPKFAQVYALAGHLIRIVAILVVAWISTGLIHKWFPHLRARIVTHMIGRRGGEDIELKKRSATLGGIVRKTAAVIIWILAIVMGLKEAGFDVGPVLAGAGGRWSGHRFGAQSLVQDVIAGLRMRRPRYVLLYA